MTRTAMLGEASSESSRAGMVRIGSGSKHRALLGVLDQAASSLSNAAAGFMVARAADPSTFGEFSLVVMSYAAMLGVSRALFSEPYAVLAFRPENRTSSYRMIGVLGKRLVALSVCSAAIAALALLMASGWHIHPLSVVLLLAFPVLAAQDQLRLAAISRGQVALALASDTLWLFLFLSGMLAEALLHGTPSALEVGISWATAGALALIPLRIGLKRNLKEDQRTRPSAALTRRAVALGAPAAFEYLILSTASQVCFFLGAWFLGTAGIAGARGALLLQGPVTVVLLGVSQALLPSLALRHDHGAGLVGSLQLRFIAFVAAVYTVLLLLPDWIGRIALGATWHDTRTVLLPWGIFALCFALSTPIVMYVRSAQAAGKLFRVRLFVAAPMLLLGIAGAGISVGALSWGLTVAQAIDTTVVIMVARGLRRQFQSESSASPHEVAGDQSPPGGGP